MKSRGPASLRSHWPARPATTVDDAIERIGLGRFQWRLLGINGLVWATDAMEVLILGFVIPSLIVGLGISSVQAGYVGSVFFGGMLVGAWGFGVLADKFGRRRIFLITVLLDAVFGLLSAFSPNLLFLLVFRFLTGAAVGGTLPVDYAVMAEYLPKKVRGRFLVYLEAFWALGTLLIALIAWGIVPALPDTGWRWLFAISAFPGLLGFFLRLWVPESPRYLLLTGRKEEAKAVLQKVADINRDNRRDRRLTRSKTHRHLDDSRAFRRCFAAAHLAPLRHVVRTLARLLRHLRVATSNFCRGRLRVCKRLRLLGPLSARAVTGLRSLGVPLGAHWQAEHFGRLPFW